jgi:hypothetical protein
MDSWVTRYYGRLPRQLYEYLPTAYEVCKKYTPVSPYRVLGEMFGVSHQRMQQVILAERQRQEQELVVARSKRPETGGPGQTPTGNPPSPVGPRDQD